MGLLLLGSEVTDKQVLVTGIPSAEAFGTPVLGIIVAPSSIQSAEAFGDPHFARSFMPTGIESGEAFGEHYVQVGAPTQSNIFVTGIPSGEAFGSVTVQLEVAFIEVTGIPSAEAFGTPHIPMRIHPTGIPSGEVFGSPFVGMHKFVVPAGATITLSVNVPGISVEPEIRMPQVLKECAVCGFMYKSNLLQRVSSSEYICVYDIDRRD